MRRVAFLIVFILVLAMALPGCGGKGGEKGQLGGKIYKKGTTDLITSEVAVSIDDKSVTTTSGEYLFTDLTTGTKTLQATATGYKAYSTTVTINPGSNTHDLEMEEGQTTISTSLSGEIRNEANGELITSSVTVSIDGKSVTTTTGKYLITDLSISIGPQKTLLSVEADGFEPYTALISIKPGSNTKDILMKRPGLVAHYKFNGDAQDSSGNGNHGKIISGVISVPGRFGNEDKAYYFDGVDDYIEVERQSFIKTERKEITVAAWVKLTPMVSRTLVFANDFVISQQTTSSKSPTTLTFSIYHTYSTPSAVKTMLKEAPYDEWVHYAGTYDGTIMKIYINGESTSSDFSETISDLGRNLNFGRDLIIPDQPTYWKGTIDDFRIYDRALSEEEIKELARHKP